MLPRSVKIGHCNYKIKMVPKKDLGKDELGEVDDSQNTIKVLSRMARSRKVEVLLHECIHAMLSGHDFKDEENIVVILGKGLSQFLADNPFFIVEALKILSAEKKFAEAVDKAADKS